MNTVERFRAAFTGQPLDRVPICGWIGMPLLRRMIGKSTYRLLCELVESPPEMVALQERLGLDPIVVTVDDR